MRLSSRIRLCIIAEVILFALLIASGIVGAIYESDTLPIHSSSSAEFWSYVRLGALWIGIPGLLLQLADGHRKKLVRQRAECGSCAA